MAAAVATSMRARSLPKFGSCQTAQLEALNEIVKRRIEDSSLNEIAKTDDYHLTSLERGVSRVEHQNLAAALDVLNAYQQDRKARSTANIGGVRMGMSRSFKHDPRTRLVELLKRWLRNNAGNLELSEDEVRNMCGLCRDVISQQNLFPSRNETSFIHTMADVYKRLQIQLREVLKRTRTCAELSQSAISLSRNLVSDAIAYLLVAATDLHQTDKLPSLEVTYLWEAFPAEGHLFPKRTADPQLQRIMAEAWNTGCGKLVKALLTTPWCIRLFDGPSQENVGNSQTAPRLSKSGDSDAEVVPALIEALRTEFQSGRFKTSGLAGCFRKSKGQEKWQTYLSIVAVVFDLTYLLGEALVQFNRISHGLGDYGMIRAAPWLHPFLEALMEKVLTLKANLEAMNEHIDEMIIMKRAKQIAVEKPAPTANMSKRAQGAIERAITSRESHSAALLRVLQDLRSQSAPERLPELQESLNDVVVQLDAVLSSPHFRARVGINFPDLPPLCALTNASQRTGIAQLVDKQHTTLGTELGTSHDDVANTDPPTTLVEGNDDLVPLGKPSLLRQETQDTPSTCSDGSFLVSKQSTELSPRERDVCVQDSPAHLQFWNDQRSPQRAGGCEFFTDSMNSVNSSRSSHSSIRHSADASSDRFGCVASLPARQRSASVPSIQRAGSQSSRGSGLFDRSVRSAASSGSASSDLFMEVTRLTAGWAGRGWHRHDVRALWLHGGQLDICVKGSRTKVKTAVDIVSDVDACSRVSDRIISLAMRRTPKIAAKGDGVEEHKVYFFEFPSADAASEFLAALSCFRNADDGTRR